MRVGCAILYDNDYLFPIKSVLFEDYDVLLIDGQGYDALPLLFPGFFIYSILYIAFLVQTSSDKRLKHKFFIR